VTVDVPAGATKEQTAALINGKADAPAYASVVGDDLVLSGKKTGVALTVTSSVLTEDPDKRRAERPAKVVIDNVVPPAEFATNTITTAIPGVELTLKGVTQAPLTIDVGAPGPDREALKKKVTAFVDAYNSTIDLIKSKTEEQTVRAPTTKADYGKGAMRGDPGLTGLLSRMRQTASATFEGDPLAKNADGFNQLFDIGISVPDSAGDKDMRLAGKLVIDADRLDAAITSNPGAVKRLFGGDSGVPGVAQAFAGLLDPVSKVTDGDLAKRAANTDRETARLKDQMTQMDARLKLKEERLRKQFTAMETALASTQSTTSWLSGQINGLTSLSS
jgi:flagellar hook-associated protein 2